MNIALITALVGQPMAMLLANTHQAVSEAMSQDQQLFVSSNMQGLHVWLRTEEGRIALQTFIEDWRSNCK